MRIKLFKLLRIQILLSVILVFIGWIIGLTDWIAGLLAGSLIAITTTIVAIVIFRRLPEVIPVKIFYNTMIANEIIKWIVVGLMTVFLLPYVSLAALTVGFIVTYLAYFCLILT